MKVFLVFVLFAVALTDGDVKTEWENDEEK
jgi:hypothetical protein